MGLIPTPMPQDSAAPMAPPQQGAPPPEAQGQDDAQANVTPEEQQQYDTFVKKAADIIYGDGKVRPEILTSLQAAKDAPPPGEQGKNGNPAVLALANTAVQVVQKLDVSAKQANYQITDDVLIHGGTEVIEMLAEVAEAAGLHSYTPDELNGALFQAIDSYRPIAIGEGRTSDATLKGQFNEVLDADSQGKLGDLLPGAGDATMGQPPVQAQGGPQPQPQQVKGRGT